MNKSYLMIETAEMVILHLHLMDGVNSSKERENQLSKEREMHLLS